MATHLTSPNTEMCRIAIYPCKGTCLVSFMPVWTRLPSQRSPDVEDKFGIQQQPVCKMQKRWHWCTWMRGGGDYSSREEMQMQIYIVLEHNYIFSTIKRLRMEDPEQDLPHDHHLPGLEEGHSHPTENFYVGGVLSHIHRCKHLNPF